MNKKKLPVIGIDVSMRTFNTHGKEYQNSRKGWQQLIKDSPPGAVFAMEATGYYHFRLASFLHSKKRAVYVCNPLWVNKYIGSLGSSVHSDKHDPANIARYFEANGKELRRWEPAPADLGRTKIILSIIANLQRQKVMSKNICHALSYVDGAKDLLSVPEYIAAQLKDQIDALGAELAEIVSKLFPREYACLLSIPGIGELTAAAMLVTTNGMQNFPGHKQLSKYLGFVPRVKQSGVSINANGHIVKCGNPYLRSLLYLCAMVAVKYNPLMRGFYEGLKARGKPSNVALVAVAHRLVRIAYGVVKSGEPYRGIRKEASNPT